MQRGGTVSRLERDAVYLLCGVAPQQPAEQRLHLHGPARTLPGRALHAAARRCLRRVDLRAQDGRAAQRLLRRAAERVPAMRGSRAAALRGGLRARRPAQR
jgi:hypothetical protein